MDASYVNAFVQGAQRVFATICQETPSLGKIFLKTNPYTVSEVTVSVDIFGAFEGEIVYNMSEHAGCFIVSRMMHGFSVTSLREDMAKSAVSELANIISGNVATIFAGKEIAVDIRTPQLRFNAVAEDFPISQKTAKIVCVPLKFNDGHIFEIDVIIP
ncbi:MAG: chemotaxis protein CheX [Defluviitaleaceae bacterium]|nr:chemotaxis protein CheX [Defluviitaleaceae bacterium]